MYSTPYRYIRQTPIEATTTSTANITAISILDTSPIDPTSTANITAISILVGAPTKIEITVMFAVEVGLKGEERRAPGPDAGTVIVSPDGLGYIKAGNPAGAGAAAAAVYGWAGMYGWAVYGTTGLAFLFRRDGGARK